MRHFCPPFFPFYINAWSNGWLEMDQEPQKCTVTFASLCCRIMGLLLPWENISIFRYPSPPLNQHIPCQPKSLLLSSRKGSSAHRLASSFGENIQRSATLSSLVWMTFIKMLGFLFVDAESVVLVDKGSRRQEPALEIPPHNDQNHGLIVGFELQLEISGFGAVLLLELPSAMVISC